MLKLSQQFGFASETGDELSRGRHMPRQNFDCNIPFHGRLVSLVDCRHASFTQRGDDLIMPKLLAGQVLHAITFYRAADMLLQSYVVDYKPVV
jgi:hypothetical protein